MKVLWLVNLPLHEMVEYINKEKAVYSTQSWLEALIAELSKQDDIEIMILAPMIIDKTYKLKNGNIQHYVIPVKDGEMYNYPVSRNSQGLLQDAVLSFKPDLIHIHGTEFTHGLTVAELAKDIPVLVSIQGLLEICARRYYADIEPIDLLRHRRLADFKYGGVPEIRKQFRKRAVHEEKLLKLVKNVIGRTDWDHAFTQAVNPNVVYYHCEEAMRKPFFESKWDISIIEKYTILAPAAYYPIKGFHMLLRAANILKRRYPDMKIKVLGPNILTSTTIKQRLLRSDYSSYLKSLIAKYGLEQSIEFLGTLSSEKVAEVMAKSHTMVVPSIVENGSNTLAEAMLIGLPCVASTSGGMMTTISHKETGFLYSFGDFELLAYYISLLWENDKLALDFSDKARAVSHGRYKAELVCKKTVDIYKLILGMNIE